MKIEDQVCSLELAKRLKELMVKQDSLFIWILNEDGHPKEGWSIFANSPYVKAYLKWKDQCSAFTVSELGEMLPTILNDGIIRLQLGWSQNISKSDKRRWKLCYCDPSTPWEERYWIEDENEANARAKCLIWLLENRLWELPE